MPRSTRTTKASLPDYSHETCRTDPRWKRTANPYPRRTRLSCHPHGARDTGIRKQKATASADRPEFPPFSPPSRVKPASRLPTVALDSGFASGFPLTMRGMGLSAVRQLPDIGEHSRPRMSLSGFIQNAVLESLYATVAYVRHSPARDCQSSRLR